MKKTLVLLSLLVLPLRISAQGVDVPPRFVIDTPTAGVLPRAGMEFSLRTYGDGGLLMNIGVGISERFMFGVSYGGVNVLGAGSVNWNQNPGVNARYQLLEENIGVPGLTMGFDSQGYGAFIDSTKRYESKSPGFFLVGSKSYDLFERLDVHLGINFSLETADDDKDPNVFLSSSLALNSNFELLAEYDVALNDNVDDSINSGKGYFNLGARLTIRSVVYVEFFVKDILENRKNTANTSRELKITYFQFIQ
jgi:hypothetical protein